MTGQTKPEQALDRLADLLVEDILSATDDEILAEAAEGPGTRGTLSRSALQKAKAIIADRASAEGSAAAAVQGADEAWSISEIRDVLSGKKRTILPDLMRALLSNAELGRTFRAAVAELVAAGRGFLIPSVASASTSDDDFERHFDGGSIRVRKLSSRPGQYGVSISMFDAARRPVVLLVEQATDYAIQDLSNVPFTGSVPLILDTANAEDAKVLRLLRDPDSKGAILPEAD